MIAQQNKSFSRANDDEVVIFVHGFLSKRLLMTALRRRVCRIGYATVNWGYVSFFGSLRNHARRLRKELDALSDQRQTIHIVAHSMGTAIVRLALSMGRLDHLGRIVFLAPPNQGSPFARWAGPLIWPLCQGVLEMSDRENSLVRKIKCCQELDVGVIAGRYDWMVPNSKTHWPEQKDHICLRATHNSMLIQRSVANQVTEYLQHGKFRHVHPANRDR